MKHIKIYINEKLHVTTKSFYTCQPTTKKELQKIIIKRIKKDGPDCDLNDIDVSRITDMSYLFNANPNHNNGNDIFVDFNGDISMWNVSNVTNMNSMFYGCEKFNGDLSRWDVSNVTDMGYMFNDCCEFNSDLSRWNVSNVKNMFSMFWKCEKLDCNLSNWNMSNVENVRYMFYYCENFNCDLSDWDVSNIEYMWHMFNNCPTQPEWYNRNKWE